MIENGFEKVYPFTTENVKEYFERMDVKDKTVLTVGSSLDQTFNAIVLGAKKITVFDISPKTFEFFKVKKDIILSKDRKDVYSTLVSDEMRKSLMDKNHIYLSRDIMPEKEVILANNYLQNDKNYQLLREGLIKADIEFITGDIFKIDETLKERKFDRIIFSNILQNLEYFFRDQDVFEVLKNNFEKWKDYLNEDGLLQLLYLYSYSYGDLYNNHTIPVYNLSKVVNTLRKYKLDIEWIRSVIGNKNDAIITYKKQK